jgi:hypothetical protein
MVLCLLSPRPSFCSFAQSSFVGERSLLLLGDLLGDADDPN